MTNPEYDIFICHASEDKEHFVRPLAILLRSVGLSVWYDEFTLSLGDRLSATIDKGLASSEFGIVVLSPAFLRKNYPQAELAGLLSRENATGEKVILPIWHELDEAEVRAYSPILADKLAVKSSRGLDAIVAEVLRVASPSRAAGTPSLAVASPALDAAWFDEHRTRALSGLHAAGFTGYMEVAMSVPKNGLKRGQSELLDIAEHSQIQAFGWPIGVVLGNRPEFRPRPRADGIVSEIALPDRSSYDYWTLRGDGDFFLLKSLFEDLKGQNSLFFDTRIVRVTETLLYAHLLYSGFGLAPDAQIRVQIRHGGLRERLLKAAGSRYLSGDRTTIEDTVMSELTCAIGSLRGDIVRNVKMLVAPLFVVFDFFRLSDSVLRDIVEGFVDEAGLAEGSRSVD